MKKHLKIAAVTAFVTTMVPFNVMSADAAGTVTVTGQAPQGYSVLMVAKSGNSTAVKGGKFSIKVSKTDAKGATLHLVTSTGVYGGPIVLKADTKKKTGNTQLSGVSGDIGKIAMKTGYSLAAAKKTTAIATTAKISVSTKGAPSGSGRMGLPSSTSGAGVKIFGVWKTGDGDAPKGEDKIGRAHV